MRLRPAIPSDLFLLRYWDTKPHIIASSGKDEQEDWETELARQPDWREWLIAEVSNHPIGIVQIIDPARDEDHYWGEIEPRLRAIDIWIGEEKYLGRGYGTQMMHFALDKCFANKTVKAVLIGPLVSNINAHRFYKRLGFYFIERRIFGNDDCLVFRLERATWNNKKALIN